MLVWLVAIAASYALGTFPTAHLVGRRLGVDPSAEGSGNPGASNVFRLRGRLAGAAVLIGDLGKGAIAAAAGLALDGRGLGLACGIAAVIGHVAPITRRLRGGKGVATAAGMSFVLYPLLSLVLAVVFVLVAVVANRASLASLVIAFVLPVLVAVAGASAWEIVAVSGLAVVVVLRHHQNIARLLRGEESGLRRSA